jgi:DNA polymerase IV (DinB-like DNA polymerase)
MPISNAYKLCPHGIYIKPNYKKYQIASDEVMKILRKYSSDFQQGGIDEAYIDVSGQCANIDEVKILVENIKNEILKKVGITISIGCAPTKSLAKIASDHDKPNGFCIISRECIKDFLKELDISCLPGLGKKTKIFYYKKGIKKIGDIIDIQLPKMIKLFGENGKWVWKVVNGLDNRKVKEFHEKRKSISKERTFHRDTNDFKVIISKLEEINENINKITSKHKIAYKTITLKIRFEGYKTYNRSKSLPYPIQDKSKVLELILDLYREFENNNKKIRLVGIKLSNFESNSKVIQTNLLPYLKIANV